MMKISHSELPLDLESTRPGSDPELLDLAQAYKREVREVRRQCMDMDPDKIEQAVGQVLGQYRQQVQEQGLDYWTFLEHAG